MKHLHPVIATASSLGLFLVSSCESQDPAAIADLQRSLAEAQAKNAALSEEIASLNEQLQSAKSQPKSTPEPLKPPSRQDVEKKLAMEATVLQQAARELFPNATVESLTTYDLDIPSFETPFTCNVKVLMRDNSGKNHTLYWSGKGNMNGEWSFTKMEKPQPQPSAPPVEIAKTPEPAPEPAPTPPAPVAPTPKPLANPEGLKVIPLTDPVMAPKGR